MRPILVLGIGILSLALACRSGDPDSEPSDTTLPVCDGQEGSEFAVRDDEVDDIVLLDEAGEVIDESPASVHIGDACQVPDVLGQCRIGAVQCTSSGLSCEQVNVPTAEAPGFDGIDHHCDGFDRYLNQAGEPHVIYVHTGADSPTLAHAIALAAECELEVDGEQVPCDVFVEGSNLLASDETVTLVEGVHVYGRFDPDQWDPTNGEFRAPSYDSSAGNSLVRVSSTPGLIAGGIQTTTPIYGLSIETQDLTGHAGCVPNIGAFVHSSPGLQLKQIEIIAGGGSHGLDGVDGETRDSDGQHGGYLDGGVASGFAAGGHGGNDGGDSGGGACPGGSELFGQDGAPSATHGGGGGTPHCDWTTVGHSLGTAGAGGVAANTASPASLPRLQFTSNRIDHLCFASEVEVLDTANGGGGGGSGVVYKRRDPPIEDDPRNTAYLRVGGGGGGWAGGAGTAGQSGGSSIAMLLIDTEDLNAESLALHAGRGGDAGAGGVGGNGTSGALPQTIDFLGSSAVGGAGGDGAGGTGGNGGNGGASISLLRINATVWAPPEALHAAGGGIGGQGGARGSPPEPWIFAPEGSEGGPGRDGHDGLDGFVCHEYVVNTGGDLISDHPIDPDHCLD
ncbi:MAG: hypothetical protein EA397_04825 [Deltaproteobacteria bacterium]|nr:MAG: hypothetical protein EA397_04825 [Deltaproteobacteria bacterium]